MSSSMKMRKDSAVTYIDIFAGAGGFSLGFDRAGFKCVGTIENDLQAGKSYAANFPDTVTLSLCRLGPEKGDIYALDKVAIEKGLLKTGIVEVDVLVGGPPCQGFSKVGRGKLNDVAKEEGGFKGDPRNDLYVRYLDLIKWIRPRVFLFENVPGILHHGGRNVAETICEMASAASYQVRCTILNTAWFGVPQIRERVFILGIRADLKIEPSFPKPVHRAELTKGHLTGVDLSKNLFRNSNFFYKSKNPKAGPPTVSVEEALGDLPSFLDHLSYGAYAAVRSKIKPQPYCSGRPNAYASLMRNWNKSLISSEVTDHFCRHTPRDYGTFARMRPGDKYSRAVEIAEQRYKEAKQRYKKGRSTSYPWRNEFIPPYQTDTFDEKWRKLISTEPSWTVTAHLAKDCYSHIHYDRTQKRAITIREAARLQSFPDAFVFKGNMGDCFRQIGNAVPPLLSFALARHIHSLLKQLK